MNYVSTSLSKNGCLENLVSYIFSNPPEVYARFIRRLRSFIMVDLCAHDHFRVCKRGEKPAAQTSKDIFFDKLIFIVGKIVQIFLLGYRFSNDSYVWYMNRV